MARLLSMSAIVLTCALALTACRMTPQERHTLARALTAAVVDNVFDVQTRAVRSSRPAVPVAGNADGQHAPTACRLHRAPVPATAAPAERSIEVTATRLDSSQVPPRTHEPSPTVIIAGLDHGRAAVDEETLFLDSDAFLRNSMAMAEAEALSRELSSTAARESLALCAGATAQAHSTRILRRELARVKSECDRQRLRILFLAHDLADAKPSDTGAYAVSAATDPAS
jgi:hypothetical protein